MISSTVVRLRRFRDEHPMLIAIGLELLILLYMLRPIVWSSYSGDDVALSQSPMWRELSGQSLFGDIGASNRFWMDVHGRFFPGSITHTFVVFTVVQTRLAYKILQLVFIVAAWGSLVGFVRAFTRSWSYAALAGAISLFTFQFRHFHDPLLQFAAQQPLLVILFFGTLSLICGAARARSPRGFWALAVSATVLWVAGLLTYETLYPIVIAPIVLIVLLMKDLRRRAMLWMISVPTATLLVVIAWLRSSVVATDPAYTMDLDPLTVLPTFLKQLTGTFPFSYQVLTNDGVTPTLVKGWSVGGRWDLVFLVLVAALLVVFVTKMRLTPLSRHQRAYLAAVGVMLLVVPSGIVAVTRRWQIGELDWGSPYVSVFLSSMGLVLVLVVIVGLLWDALTDEHRPRQDARRIGRRVVLTSGVLLLVLGPLIIADTNVWVVDQFARLRSDREAFVEVIEDGTFDDVAPGSIVIADGASSWFWVNQAFVAWYGGPAHLRFITPDDPVLSECEAAQCYRYVPGSPARVIPLVVDP